jgi:hypothetical protein
MTTPEPPVSSRHERRDAIRRRNRRIAVIAGIVIVLLAAGGAAALVLGGDDDGDDDSTQTSNRSSTTTTAAPTTTPETASADPAACLRGTFRFISQVYSAPANTVYGPTNIEGGVSGRTIELRPDGTFHFEDTGRDRVNFELISTGTTGTAVLDATAEGTYTADATTGNFDVTQLAGTLTLTLADGQVIPVPLPADAAGVEETFGLTGGATYTCDADRVTVQFPTVTIELERADG